MAIRASFESGRGMHLSGGETLSLMVNCRLWVEITECIKLAKCLSLGLISLITLMPEMTYSVCVGEHDW